jgi:hypothetical protein
MYLSRNLEDYEFLLLIWKAWLPFPTVEQVEALDLSQVHVLFISILHVQ